MAELAPQGQMSIRRLEHGSSSGPKSARPLKRLEMPLRHSVQARVRSTWLAVLVADLSQEVTPAPA